MGVLTSSRTSRVPLASATTLVVCLAAAAAPARAQQIPQEKLQPPVQTQPGQQQPIQAEQPKTTPDTEEPQGPFRDLFVRPSRRQNGQTMTFSLSGYGGYDSNVVADQAVNRSGVDPRAQGGGSSMLGTDAGLQYVKQERRVSFALN